MSLTGQGQEERHRCRELPGHGWEPGRGLRRAGAAALRPRSAQLGFLLNGPRLIPGRLPPSPPPSPGAEKRSRGLHSEK